MTIDELKRALVEVSEMCASSICSRCPFSKRDRENIPRCPMHETEDCENIYWLSDWDVDDWKEDSK